MIYLQLLWSFIQIGLFSIGGGYAAMPIIQHQVIDIHGETKLQLDRFERPDSGITDDGIISIYNTQTSEHYYKNLDGDKITIEVK